MKRQLDDRQTIVQPELYNAQLILDLEEIEPPSFLFFPSLFPNQGHESDMAQGLLFIFIFVQPGQPH